MKHWKPGTSLTLETESYVVRSMTPADMSDSYIAWLADAELMEGLNQPPREVTAEQLAKYIESFDNRLTYHLGIFWKETGEQVGFYNVKIQRKSRNAETSVVIGNRDFWGRKVVLETREAILEFLFARVQVERVYGSPFERNFPSIFNYKAQGFTFEAVLRKHARRANGDRVDVYVFGLMRDEWLAMRGARARVTPAGERKAAEIEDKTWA